MVRRRSALETMCQMLNIIKDNKRATIKKTWLMYKANISWNPMMKLLKYMQKTNLIEFVKDRPKDAIEKVHITPKGKEVVTMYNQLRERIKSG